MNGSRKDFNCGCVLQLAAASVPYGITGSLYGPKAH